VFGIGRRQGIAASIRHSHHAKGERENRKGTTNRKRLGRVSLREPKEGKKKTEQRGTRRSRARRGISRREKRDAPRIRKTRIGSIKGAGRKRLHQRNTRGKQCPSNGRLSADLSGSRRERKGALPHQEEKRGSPRKKGRGCTQIISISRKNGGVA